MKEKERKIILSGDAFYYSLTKKKVKNINLRINRTGDILVSCPFRVTIKEVEKVLCDNEKFIRKSLEKLNIAKSKKEYNTGEKIRIFDKECVLSILPGRKNVAYLKEDKINVLLTDIDNIELRKRTIRRLQDRIAKEEIEKMVNEIYPLYKSHVKEIPKLSLRRTISQWGCCNKSKNRLSFNLSLVELPLMCTKYVVVHEFSHFIYFDHSKEFYKEIEKVMPDYQKYRKKLSKIIIEK